MKGKTGFCCFILSLLGLVTVLAGGALAADPIVMGVPTSLGFLEGKEGLFAVNMAVDEINAAGGVNVGGAKRIFQVESIDIRDAAPGVPVPEALLGLEKTYP